MVRPSRAFQAVRSRLHTDDKPDDAIFVFHFIRGHVPGGWAEFATSVQAGKDL